MRNPKRRNLLTKILVLLMTLIASFQTHSISGHQHSFHRTWKPRRSFVKYIPSICQYYLSCKGNSCCQNYQRFLYNKCCRYNRFCCCCKKWNFMQSRIQYSYPRETTIQINIPRTFLSSSSNYGKRKNRYSFEFGYDFSEDSSDYTEDLPKYYF